MNFLINAMFMFVDVLDRTHWSEYDVSAQTERKLWA